MARQRRERKMSVSLFPFLSVLVSAMGVLIVVISGQTTLAVPGADMELELVGTEQARQPTYVECRRDGVLIHPEGTLVPLANLRRDQSSKFADLLDELELSGGKRYLVLLVRPEGIESYHRADQLAREVWRGIRVGKDALPPGQGKLVFRTGGRPAGASRGGRRQP